MQTVIPLDKNSIFLSTVRTCGLARLEDTPEETLSMFGAGEFDRPKLSPLSHWTEHVNKHTIALAVLNAMQASKAKVIRFRVEHSTPIRVANVT